ncbi:MAG TPA: 8-amino-7-oxononanoate synthase [Sedimentisphaerales bacterium]|nr:8-amino-7-oxononanoate synthase [Sedimentisphaerales bacterium]
MDKFDFVAAQLDELKRANLLREPRCIDSAQATSVRIDGREKVLFCSNNYLGLADHPKVIQAVIDAVRQYGHGAGASRLISGTMRPHVELEKDLARLFRKDAALVFPSGWTANEAVIKTIPSKGDLLLLDKLDHASIIDAARSSEAQFRTYRRDNLNRLEKFLADKSCARKFIITESIFSMDGDAADLKTLVELKVKYDAFLIVDEAHALGCLGETGAGLAEEMGLLDQVDIVVGTMSKALGSAGGVAAAKKVVVDLLINKARCFIYTTAPTVANCAAARAALEIVRTEPHRRERLRQNAEYLRTKLNRLGINTGRSISHIVPVIIGGEKEALAVSRSLYEAGFFVPAIRPPTVPAGTARLRLSLQSEHSKEQMDALCEALEKLVRQGFLPASSPAV